MRYFIHLAYNGAKYFGWQIQPKHPSVQAELTHVFSKILNQPLTIVGAGRTDTGVHARSYYAHFDVDFDLTKENKNTFLSRVNSFLPKDIVVYDLFSVPENAHARFDAVKRTYRYYVSTQKNPFLLDTAFRVYFQPDLQAMNDCCEELKKHSDFTSFSKLHTDVNNNDCVIFDAFWKEENGLLIFEITANRFLRNMVRAIVGTMLDVGKGKLNVEEFRNIILQKDRCCAGVSVPPHALFLEEIVYSENIGL